MTSLPAILAVEDDQGPIVGVTPNQGFTDDASPLIRVSVAGTAASAGDRVQLYSAITGAPVGPATTLTAADLAAGSLGVQLNGLMAGQYPLGVKLLGPDGAVLAASDAPAVFNLALAAPATPSIRQAFDDSSGQWNPASGGHTADATPVIQVFMPGVSENTGPVSPGHPPYGDTNPIHGGTVLLYADGQLAGRGTIGAWGYVTVVADGLQPGAHSLTAVAEDRAGNLSAASAPFTLTIDGPAAGAVAASPVVAAGPAVSLGAAAGWTDAAVLADGTLAVVGAVDGGYGSRQAAAWTFDGAGAQAGSAAPAGYAAAGEALEPQITALDGGFYKVGYAGSTDYGIYAADGRQAFVHNAYTGGDGAFTALKGGGYLVSDAAAGVFGLFDAHGANLAWTALPGPGLSATALDGGGFVFAGGGAFDIYDAAGGPVAEGRLGASVSGFAGAVTATAGGGFMAAWLSADGGAGGLASAVTLQAFDAAGRAEGEAVVVAQDLDPWHTAFRLQAHGDGAATLLWSQGGGVFGAEYAQGAAGPAHAAAAGDLADMQAVALSDGRTGLAWLQDGQVWAEIFDAADGAVHRAALGSATGDLSTVHALATDGGGLAVSWRGEAGVLVGVLDAAGRAGPAAPIAGDLLGVDAAGRALTLHDEGGTPVLQAYALADGLFWTG